MSSISLENTIAFGNMVRITNTNEIEENKNHTRCLILLRMTISRNHNKKHNLGI